MKALIKKDTFTLVFSTVFSREDIKDCLFEIYLVSWGFPGGSVVKESICNAEDTGDADSIPGLRRAPGGGHGNPLHYSCLESLMDRGAWQVQSIGSQRVRRD